MTITASQVFELRKMTGCGMMDCKKALQETDGDTDQAVDLLRKKGIAKAAKAASRVAAEGVVSVLCGDAGKLAVILEVNTETDFVARDENFLAFVQQISEFALTNRIESLEELLRSTIDGKSIEQLRQELVAKLGENICVRRMMTMASDGLIGHYVHGARIGVLVALKEGGSSDLAKDLAMHIAASNPKVTSPQAVSTELVEKERQIFKDQALASGKPENIVNKMVEGRINKFLNEMSLTGQAFVKNPDITVGQLLNEKQAEVETFVRFELGEGIEKKTTDFAKEVMEQVKGH